MLVAVHTDADYLLQVKDLAVDFPAKTAGLLPLRALDGVDLAVRSREIVGLVGESGSGKSVFSLSVLRLILRPGNIRAGQVMWQGRDVLRLPEHEVRQLRGGEIAMIFQNPQSSLNPVRTIGAQISGVIRLHQGSDPTAAKNEALGWLRAVRIAEPERVYMAYPHECSGGMCQRILIAMALSCRPKLLIADEPTASLDVTIQAQIMDLLLEVREKYDMAILLVSHDLGVIARMCDRIAVMYNGRIVEQANAVDLYSNPLHPYTRMLLQSVPIPDPLHRPKRNTPVDFVMSAGLEEQACRFIGRCPERIGECSERDPLLVPMGPDGHEVACLRRVQEQNATTGLVGLASQMN